MPRLSRMAPALLLAAILATPAVLAAPPGGAWARRSTVLPSGPLDSLAQLWQYLMRAWEKNGGQADPSGAQTKNGFQIDPSGNSSQPLPPPPSGVHTKNGGQMDPSGNSLQTIPPPALNPNNDPVAYPHG